MILFALIVVVIIMTDVRALKNTMLEYEARYKIIIPDDYYFVVKLVSSSESKNNEDVSDLFFDNYDNCRLVLSYPTGEYHILFDPLKKQPDHVSLASELASLYTHETGE